MNIFIGDLPRAAVLAALYNNSKPLGMGFLHYTPEDMTVEEAEEHLAESISDTGFVRRQNYFDYLKGRVMKVDLSGDSFDPHLYDRDNGENAARDVIAQLRIDLNIPEPGLA